MSVWGSLFFVLNQFFIEHSIHFDKITIFLLGLPLVLIISIIGGFLFGVTVGPLRKKSKNRILISSLVGLLFGLCFSILLFFWSKTFSLKAALFCLTLGTISGVITEMACVIFKKKESP